MGTQFQAFMGHTLMVSQGVWPAHNLAFIWTLSRRCNTSSHKFRLIQELEVGGNRRSSLLRGQDPLCPREVLSDLRASRCHRQPGSIYPHPHLRACNIVMKCSSNNNSKPSRHLCHLLKLFETNVPVKRTGKESISNKGGPRVQAGHLHLVGWYLSRDCYPVHALTEIKFKT